MCVAYILQCTSRGFPSEARANFLGVVAINAMTCLETFLCQKNKEKCTFFVEKRGILNITLFKFATEFDKLLLRSNLFGSSKKSLEREWLPTG